MKFLNILSSIYDMYKVVKMINLYLFLESTIARHNSAKIHFKSLMNYALILLTFRIKFFFKALALLSDFRIYKSQVNQSKHYHYSLTSITFLVKIKDMLLIVKYLKKLHPHCINAKDIMFLILWNLPDKVLKLKQKSEFFSFFID